MVQGDRGKSKRNSGLVIVLMTLIGLAVVAATYYLWANGNIAKDMVAAVFIGVVILSIIVINVSSRR